MLADEYGTVQSVSLDFQSRAFTMGVAAPAGGANPGFGGAWAQPGPGGPPTPMPVECEFSSSTTYGVAVLMAVPNPQTPADVFRVDSFTLISEDGTLSFPFPSDDE